MNKKNTVEVIINNKQYILGGYESPEYLQKIASYINGKYNEFKKQDFYKHLDRDMKNILIEINIADDYHKAIDQIEVIQAKNEENNTEIYNLRHELVATRSELESAQDEIKELKKELAMAQNKLIRLDNTI
ncbi:MAG: cell division protein ZapA, partial [Clostridiales bacterium]|nr:cell division protein ZapA [Clostridiales bacterium]